MKIDDMTRREFLRRFTAATAAGLAGGAMLGAGRLMGAGPAALAAPLTAGQGKRPNVLLIAVDDLRPELGCYGESHMLTPNMDAFAASGRLFRRQYVAMPTCGASRCALLTGQRPRSPERMVNGAFNTLSREETEHPQTMPELFRRSGYRTVSIGKISHQPDGHVFTYRGEGDGRQEVPFAWDEATCPTGKWQTAWNAFFGYADGSSRTYNPNAQAAEAGDVDDDGYPDGLIAQAGVDKLGDLSRSSQPFMLGVGFFKPHLPFTAPKKYWDMYDRDKIPMSPVPEKPDGINPASWHNSFEAFTKAYNLPPEKRGDEATRRWLRHGYYAAVSYVDAQVGRVLKAVDDLALASNTIVVIWGDHGWHLGDHDIWGKHTRYEWALRSAMMMRTPGMASPGRASNSLVESIDLYPTIAGLCGVKTPPTIDGTSIEPILNDPDAAVKDAAYGYWRRGVTMRTDSHRITGYEQGEPLVELYDHRSDRHEARNVADQQPQVVAELLPRLREHAATWPGLQLP